MKYARDELCLVTARLKFYMHLRLISTLATCALLAACSAPERAAPPDNRREIAPRGGLCNAAPAQTAVGQAGTARNVEAARVSAGALMARTVSPGQVMTKEWSADRLNLVLDSRGKITHVTCG